MATSEPLWVMLTVRAAVVGADSDTVPTKGLPPTSEAGFKLKLVNARPFMVNVLVNVCVLFGKIIWAKIVVVRSTRSWVVVSAKVLEDVLTGTDTVAGIAVWAELSAK